MRSDIRNQLYTGRNPVGAAGFLHCQQYSPQLLIPFISDIYFLLFKAAVRRFHLIHLHYCVNVYWLARGRLWTHF